jgi:hypothetical protein
LSKKEEPPKKEAKEVKKEEQELDIKADVDALVGDSDLSEEECCGSAGGGVWLRGCGC